MRNYSRILSYVEKIFFLVALVIVVIFATGYKFDSQKNEFIQTGALQLDNVEDNTKVYFNNQVYDNKNNLSVNLLNEGPYDLKITKEQRREYSTTVNVLKSESTHITPVLIPEIIKSTTLNRNIYLLANTEKSLYYLINENNNYYIERLNINSSFFSIDSTKSRITIPSTIDVNQFKSSVISKVSENENLLAVYAKPNILLMDFSKSVITNISSYIPQGTVKKLEFKGNFLFISYDQDLYSVDINDFNKIQRNLIFTGKDFVYSISDNDVVNILYKDKDAYYQENYTLNGTIQFKKKIESSFPLNLNVNSQLAFFNKELYLLESNNLYTILDTKVASQDEDYIKFKYIDRNTIIFYGNSKLKILNLEKEYNTTIKSYEYVNISLSKDIFTYFYVDTDNKLHVADLGGQDNIISENVDPKFVSIQNGADTNIYYETGGEIHIIKLGNKG